VYPLRLRIEFPSNIYLGGDLPHASYPALQFAVADRKGDFLRLSNFAAASSQQMTARRSMH
jgi:hypothetical protein